MNTRNKNEEQAMLLVCLNNAGVKAFERGDLDKALKLFICAINSVMATLNLDTDAPKISKKQAMKVVKSQSKCFLADKSFEICESTIFGKRRRDRQLAAPWFSKNEKSSTYTYQRVFALKASNSEPILDQTSPEQLTGIVLSNLAICHHLYPGHIRKATHYYELAVKAASISGDLLPQLVIWNNLLQVYSNDLLEEDTARACMTQLETKIKEIRDRGLLPKLKKDDRRGFLLNVMLSNRTTLAPAAWQPNIYMYQHHLLYRVQVPVAHFQ